MELHTLDVAIAVPQAHDQAVVGLCGDVERIRQGGAIDNQRVIASGLDRVRETAKHADVAMTDHRSLAVHDLRRSHHITTEGLPHALHAEAHPKDRCVGREAGQDVHAHARVVGVAGTGRDKHAVWVECPYAVEVDLVVTSHNRTRAELPEVLHEDIDERVVVVDDEDGRRVRHGR